MARYQPDERFRRPWRWTPTLPATEAVPEAAPAAEAGPTEAPAPAPIEDPGAAPRADATNDDTNGDSGPGQGREAEPESPPQGNAKNPGKALGRGDRINVFLRGIPKPEDVMEVIDDDGDITLPLVGTVRVAGMSTAVAEKTIMQAYIDGDFYSKITVIVVTQEDEYFVRGEVNRQGKYELTPGLTLLQAIPAAGGYTDFAKPSDIKIIRGDEVLRVNAERIEKRREKDPLIRPDDIIIVPPDPPGRHHHRAPFQVGDVGRGDDQESRHSRGRPAAAVGRRPRHGTRGPCRRRPGPVLPGEVRNGAHQPARHTAPLCRRSPSLPVQLCGLHLGR
jgi:polysaccharide export outer membrane protein